jgi:NAD(P)-dependent dehydrogenase (short-subunit alcohol dehydrogenase family)
MTVAIVPGWTADDIPDLTGVRAVVTGATSGLGEATAVELARRGAHVVLTARDAGRGEQAAARVRASAPGASVELGALDLADLSSVRAFAADLVDRPGREPLDLLVNNAGVMAVPPRRTVDGFELQIATNHLGPFALTGLLLPALLRRPGARVVTVSSFVHRFGSLRLGDLMSEQSYDPWQAYYRSKLANLLFMRELGRRAAAARVDLVSAAAHPGWARTNLQYVGPRTTGRRGGVALARTANAVLGQSATAGALPQLRAATDPGVRSGDYFGPRGLGEQRGLPRRVGMSRAARDDLAARALWEASERLTGVRYVQLQPASAAPGQAST